jgi:hypothetical protein
MSQPEDALAAPARRNAADYAMLAEDYRKDKKL